MSESEPDRRLFGEGDSEPSISVALVSHRYSDKATFYVRFPNGRKILLKGGVSADIVSAVSENQLAGRDLTLPELAEQVYDPSKRTSRLPQIWSRVAAARYAILTINNRLQGTGWRIATGKWVHSGLRNYHVNTIFWEKTS